MKTRDKRSRTSLTLTVENLEGRVVLSAMTAATTMPQAAVQVAAQSVKAAATTTTFSVSAGTLGQPLKLSVTVKGPASAGSPTGTVNILDHGQILTTLSLVPSTTSGKFAVSQATSTLNAQPGGGAYYFGSHTLTAQYVPSGSLQKSSASKSFVVTQPHYTTLPDGVKVATIATGTGAAITTGQTASVYYTGYLPKTGQIFDDSLKDGGTPLTFKLGSGAVIPGFDAGTVGMKLGETRLILIPASQGYGATANGSIPANSSLLFVQTLESIS